MFELMFAVVLEEILQHMPCLWAVVGVEEVE